MEHLKLVREQTTWAANNTPPFHNLGGPRPATARLVAAAYWAALREVFADFLR